MRVDNRKLYEKFSLWWNSESTMVVYLPNEDYNSLKLSTLSGDVIVSDVFSFSEAHIKSVSGDVEYSAFTDNLLNIKSTSGDIECMSEAKDVRLKTTSGDIHTGSCSSSDFLLKAPAEISERVLFTASIQH